VRVAVTESEAQRIDEEWVQHRERQQVLADVHEGLAAERERLAQKLGAMPLEHDVIWSLMLKQRNQHSKQREWGFSETTPFAWHLFCDQRAGMLLR